MTPWANSSPSKTSLRSVIASPTPSNIYKPKQYGFRPFGTANQFNPHLSQPPASPFNQFNAQQPANPSQNPCPMIVESAEPPNSPTKHFKADIPPTNSKPVMQSLSPEMLNEYQATVQTTSKQFSNLPSINVDQSNLENISPNIQTQTTNTPQLGQTNSTVKDTTGPNTSSPLGAAHHESLSYPDQAGSSGSSPFPPRVPPSPTPSMGRRTPILVTTRPSSVIHDRTRHVSKDDLARMMAELNAPLPPMIEIPDEIRASPLIFSHGGLAAVSSFPNTSLSTSSHVSSSSFACNSTTSHTSQ